MQEYLGLVGSCVDSTEFENLVNGLVIFGRYLVSLSPPLFNIIKLLSFALRMRNEFMTREDYSLAESCQVESYSRQLHKVVSQINSRRYCFVRVIICFNSYGLIPTLLVESLYFPEQIVATPILQSNSQIILPFLLCEFYFIFSAVLYFVRYFSYSVLILLSLEYIADSNKIQFSTKSFLPATLDCCFQSF